MGMLIPLFKFNSNATTSLKLLPQESLYPSSSGSQIDLVNSAIFPRSYCPPLSGPHQSFQQPVRPCGQHMEVLSWRTDKLLMVSFVGYGDFQCSSQQQCPACMRDQVASVMSDSLPPYGLNPPGSSVHGILKARRLEWVATPSSSGIFPTQGSNPHILCLLNCRQILYLGATGEAQCIPKFRDASTNSGGLPSRPSDRGEIRFPFPTPTSPSGKWQSFRQNGTHP